jgi:hypothetical protein
MHFLLLLSIAGLITSTMYALLVVVGALRLAKRRRGEPAGVFTPRVSLLKPLHGWEPDLELHQASSRASSGDTVQLPVEWACAVCQCKSVVAGAYAKCGCAPVFRGQR